MTIDQILMLLCEKEILQNRKKKVSALEASQLISDADGTIKGRAADGTPIRGRIRGKSVVQELREKMAAEEAKKAPNKSGRRRRRRGN